MVPGHADASDRWNFTLVYNSINGPMKTLMERIRVRGALHTFTDFKPRLALYTSPGGRTTFYIPHRRRNAAQVLSGLSYRGYEVNTDNFPVRISVDGTDKAVSYSSSLPLVDPGPGAAVVSSIVDSTGHAPFLMGDSVPAGTEIELEIFPLFEVSMMEPIIEFSQAGNEKHTYKFQER
jgi:hypothetical protein